MSLKEQMNQVLQLQNELKQKKEREKELLHMLMLFWDSEKEEWEHETSREIGQTDTNMR